MKSQSGFTLLELLAVIMVIGISLAIAVPSYQGMVARNGIATQVNGYLLAINLARSEAMRRGSPVSIQSADNGADGADEFGNGYCVQVGTPGASGFSTSCASVEEHRPLTYCCICSVEMCSPICELFSNFLFYTVFNISFSVLYVTLYIFKVKSRCIYYFLVRFLL